MLLLQTVNVFSRETFSVVDSTVDPLPALKPVSLFSNDLAPYFGGEAGIRTLGGLLTLNGFQDRRIQPLCHLS